LNGFSGCLNAGAILGSLKTLPRRYGLLASRVLALIWDEMDGVCSKLDWATVFRLPLKTSQGSLKRHLPPLNRPALLLLNYIPFHHRQPQKAA